MQVWIMLVTLVAGNPAPALHYKDQTMCEQDARLIAEDTVNVKSATCHSSSALAQLGPR